MITYDPAEYSRWLKNLYNEIGKASNTFIEWRADLDMSTHNGETLNAPIDCTGGDGGMSKTSWKDCGVPRSSGRYPWDSRVVPAIKKVIFNGPATIVYWADESRTVVKKGPNEPYFDPEKGLAMAIAKKALGNLGNYYNYMRPWLPRELNIPDEPEDVSAVNNEEDIKRCIHAYEHARQIFGEEVLSKGLVINSNFRDDELYKKYFLEYVGRNKKRQYVYKTMSQTMFTK